MSSPSRTTRSGTDSPRGTPQAGVAVAVTQCTICDQLLVGLHADLGVDVVALYFADQRIQAGTGVESLTQQSSQAVDQCVFMCAVQWVTGLKCHNSILAIFGQQFANFAWCQNVLAE